MRLPELGVGSVYSPELRPLAESPRSLIDVLEVEPQGAFLPAAGAPGEETSHRVDARWIAALRELPQPKLVHSVGAPVGGVRPPDGRQVAPLLHTIATLGAPWATEHLSFNQGAGRPGPFEA